MSHHPRNQQPISAELAAIIGAAVSIGLMVILNFIVQRLAAPAGPVSLTPLPQPLHTPVAVPVTPTTTPLPGLTPGPTVTFTPTGTPSPTITPTPTPTPTPTLNLMTCNAAGCGPQAQPLPTVAYDTNLLLRADTPRRRFCAECPPNQFLSNQELNSLVTADPATIKQLQLAALSQQPYQIAPGLVYIVSDYVHHVVVDLEQPGLKLRNIIPPIPNEETQKEIRITPSYCMRPESLLIMTADYHGLVGSNKTEEGRELFFHLGRAALFERDGKFDIDVIREHSDFAATSVSWGGGPIFMWDGKYDFNPEQEWFTPENLEHYRTTRWAKLTVTVSEERKYLFISASYGLTLKEHAENIIKLAQNWGIKADRAMRFDGSESAYIAIRMGNFMTPILALPEPLIVNCLAIEQSP